MLDVDEIGDSSVLLCQYLMWNDDNSFSLEEVTYINGDNCVNTTAEVLWMQHISASPVTSAQVIEPADSLSSHDNINAFFMFSM